MLKKTRVVVFLVIILISNSSWSSQPNSTFFFERFPVFLKAFPNERERSMYIRNFRSPEEAAQFYEQAVIQDEQRRSPIGNALELGDKDALEEAIRDSARNMYCEKRFDQEVCETFGKSSFWATLLAGLS